MTADPPSGLLGPEVWSALVQRIARLGELAYGDDVPADDQARAEAVRYLLRFLAAGIAVCVEHDDTETPELGRMTENRMSWGLDNPDCLYSYTRVRGDAVYRIRGNRGTATHLELQVNTGHFGDGDFMGWRAVSALDGDALVTDEHGEFELWLAPDGRVPVVVSPSTERPAHLANQMRIDDTASFLLVRQYFGDWERERPADLVIDNLDAHLPPLPLSGEALAPRLDLLGQWLDVGARCWRDLSAGLLANEPAAITPFLPPASASGLKGQAYGMGSFRCGPDEAVILELDPPQARLWGLSLCDRSWQSIDFAAHTSSLNSFQSVLTGDGRFVGVISQDPPGVANWLDPAGHTAGTLAVRYLFADSLPTLEYRVVHRADLERALPADTPRRTLSDADDQAARSRRRAAVTRRYRR